MRKEFSVPLHDQTRYLVVTDPEVTSNSIGLSYKFPKTKVLNTIEENIMSFP